MQIAAPATGFRPSLVLVAKHLIDNRIDTPVYRYDRIGDATGYADAERAIHDLRALTDGPRAGAALLLEREGRFFGYTAFEGPTWIAAAGSDLIGRPHAYEPLHLTRGTQLEFRDESVVAFIDGAVLLHRPAT